tara:strand:+ start:1240 stop:1560 length:321 start_codon:yes stop_codon:yes gene_type:complete
MGKKNSLKDIQRFCDVISEEVNLRFGIDATVKDLILHLSQHGLIKPITIRNFLIVNDFYKQLIKNKGHMTYTFMDMSIEYNLSERQIQTIIYEYQKKFEIKNNVCR